MKNVARSARLRKLTERVAARLVCAASADVKGKDITITAEIKPRAMYTNLVMEAMRYAERDVLALKSAMLGMLEDAGIDSRWSLPTLVPDKKMSLTLLGVADMAIPKDLGNEMRNIRASVARSRAEALPEVDEMLEYASKALSRNREQVTTAQVAISNIEENVVSAAGDIHEAMKATDDDSDRRDFAKGEADLLNAVKALRRVNKAIGSIAELSAKVSRSLL